MSDTYLLIFGIVVFGLMLIGMVLTVLEFRQLADDDSSGSDSESERHSSSG